MTTHQPILVEEILSALDIIPDGIYIDGTFGQGGHTKKLLQRLNARGYILAIDQDPTSSQYKEPLCGKDKRFSFCCESFMYLEKISQSYQILGKVNGIILDLGTSATQLDDPKRGFSFLKQGPLDMRMNFLKGNSAREWILNASVSQMTTVFREYGEERWANRIAKAIVRERLKATIDTTTQLAQIVKAAHPRWSHKIHPATRVFQALRIQINQELTALQTFLTQVSKVLAPQGKLVVITFHSLEARVIKEFILSPQNENFGYGRLRWKHKSIKPTRQEIILNRRARSALLRVMEKI